MMGRDLLFIIEALERRQRASVVLRRLIETGVLVASPAIQRVLARARWRRDLADPPIMP